MHISSVSRMLLVVSIIAGAAFAAIVENLWPLYITVPIGLYLLFAIKVADQWEKVAKGSMIIVPSSAVETMGLGGTLATAALANGPKP